MPVQVRVGDQQCVDGYHVVRDVLDHFLPVRDGLGIVPQVLLQKPGNALDEVKFFAGRPRVAQVVFQHLHQPRLVTRLFQDGFQAQQGVVVAG